MADRRKKGFTADKAFEERFRPAVREILTNLTDIPVLAAYVAPEIDDFYHNKDWGLIVDLQSHDRDSHLSVSSRIRRAEYKTRRTRNGHRYTREFTIRATRPSGAATEARKMRLGYGDLMIYGFETEDGSDQLGPWVVLSLNILNRWTAEGRRWREHKPNADGSSTFHTYWIEDIPEASVVDSFGIPYPLIGANKRATADGRYAPYTRSDDWAETTRVHPDPTAPKGWTCPECEARTETFYGAPNKYDPVRHRYIGGDTLRCHHCATTNAA